MKGMQSIKRGTGFSGVAAYMLDDPNAELLGGNMSGRTAKELGREFNVSRQLRPDIKKPTWHNSLRLPEGEKLSHDQWVRVCDEYMQRMGFTDAHQRVYVMHDDPKGQHVHIAASRVGLDGMVYLGQNENLKSTRVIQALERDFGLTVTPGPTVENGRIKAPQARRPTAGEVGKFERTGEAPARFQLAQLIDQALKDKPTVVQFVERLQLAGVEVKPNLSKSGLNGFGFAIDGVAFKGSQLGDKYKYKGLLSRGLSYEQNRDYEKLRSLAASAGNSQERGGNTADTAFPGRGAVGGSIAPGSGDSIQGIGEVVRGGDSADIGGCNSYTAEIPGNDVTTGRTTEKTSSAWREEPASTETNRPDTEAQRPGAGDNRTENASNSGNMSSSNKPAGPINSSVEVPLGSIIKTGNPVIDRQRQEWAQEQKQREEESIRATAKMFENMAESSRKNAAAVTAYISRLFSNSARFVRDARNYVRPANVDQVQQHQVKQQPQEAPRQALQGADLDAALAGLEQAPSRLEQHRQAMAERERLQAEAERERQQKREAERSLEIAYDKKL
ncbi:TPA: relaxase/mobilization nuclease domain-containing protein [Pseudomonas aeruginosa]